MGSPFAQGFTTGQWFPWVYQGRGRGGDGRPARINFGGFEMTDRQAQRIVQRQMGLSDKEALELSEMDKRQE